MADETGIKDAEEQNPGGDEIIDLSFMDRDAEAFGKRLEALTPEEAAQKDDEIDKYITKEKVSELTQHMQVYGDKRDDALVDFVTMDAKMTAYEGVKQGAPEKVYDGVIAGVVEETELIMAQSAASEQYFYEAACIDAKIKAEKNPEKKNELEKELKEKQQQFSDVHNITSIQDCKDRNIDIKNSSNTFSSFMAAKMVAIGKKVDKVKEKCGITKIEKFFEDADKSLADSYGKAYTIPRDLAKLGKKVAMPFIVSKLCPVASLPYAGLKVSQGLANFELGRIKQNEEITKKFNETLEERRSLENMAKNNSPEFTEEKQARLKELQGLKTMSRLDYIKSHAADAVVLGLGTAALFLGLTSKMIDAETVKAAIDGVKTVAIDAKAIIAGTIGMAKIVDNALPQTVPVDERMSEDTIVNKAVDDRPKEEIKGETKEETKETKGVWGKLKTAWEKTGRTFEQLSNKLSPGKKKAMEKEISLVQQPVTIEKQAEPAKKEQKSSSDKLFSKMMKNNMIINKIKGVRS